MLDKNCLFNELMNAIKQYNKVVFARFPDSDIKARVTGMLSEIKEILKTFTNTENWFKKKIFCENGDDFANIEIIDLGVTNILLFDLYEYLLHVVKETLIDHMNDEKWKEIRELQKNVDVMIGERDIIKVYNCIETELQKYGEELFG